MSLIYCLPPTKVPENISDVWLILTVHPGLINYMQRVHGDMTAPRWYSMIRLSV